LVTFANFPIVAVDLLSLRLVPSSFYFSSSSVYFALHLTAILAVYQASEQSPI
jgi:hypothetical protein